MINILAVGNSFTNNTMRYLHVLAAQAGVEIHTVNLFIGGCPLAKHWDNIQADRAAYLYESDGIADESRGPVSVQAALAEAKWDYIVSQQASQDSGILSSYEPYASEVYAYLHAQAPQAELWIQQTWAYDQATEHEAFMRYHHSQSQMYQMLTHAYLTVAKAHQLPIIPTGQLIQILRTLPAFTRPEAPALNAPDGYHLSDYGKYAAALLWLRIFAGVDPDSVPLESVPGLSIDQLDRTALLAARHAAATMSLTLQPV